MRAASGPGARVRVAGDTGGIGGIGGIGGAACTRHPVRRVPAVGRRVGGQVAPAPPCSIRHVADVQHCFLTMSNEVHVSVGHL